MAGRKPLSTVAPVAWQVIEGTRHAYRPVAPPGDYGDQVTSVCRQVTFHTSELPINAFESDCGACWKALTGR